MNDDPHYAFLETAQLAAQQAAELLEYKWHQPRQVSQKGFRDWVTDADKAAQELITNIIRQRFPDHAFLTEEDDTNLPTKGPVYWVIDPVDGTSNYSRQIPVYCISIAAAIAGPSDGQSTDAEVVAGVILDPSRGEIFSALRGRGAHCNYRPLQVSSTTDLTEAIVALDWSREPILRQQARATIDRLAAQAHTIRAVGSAALGLAWVAAGRFDGYFNLSIGPWDGAAASLIIREAGGQFDNTVGQSWRLGDNNCLASNGLLQPALAATLNEPQ